MNGQTLMNVIGEIDDRYILEFAEIKPLKKNNLQLFKILSAACLAVVAISTIVFRISHNTDLPQLNSSNNATPNLPETFFSSSEEPYGTYQKLEVDYNNARNLFAHDIKKCVAHNFTGYVVKIITKNGIDSGDAVCLSVIYNFTNGTIAIEDQDRLIDSFLSWEAPEKIEYKGRRFIIDPCPGDNYIRYGYYPTEQNGLAYIAEFDDSMDQSAILDLIISLEI